MGQDGDWPSLHLDGMTNLDGQSHLYPPGGLLVAMCGWLGDGLGQARQ